MRTLACCLLLSAPSFAAAGGSGAQGLLSVLELRNKLQGADRQAVDTGYLTDRVRSEVFDSPLDVKVMTRENMTVLLEAAGKKLEDCEGSCEADTGRKLGADYVVSGQVLRSGSELKLILSLYETQGGTLVGTVTESGKDVDALDGALKGAVAKLVAPLVQPTAPAQPVAQAEPARNPGMGAVRMDIAAPPQGRWFLRDGTGAQLCKLPCTKMVPRGNDYYAELDADRASDRRQVKLPSAMEFSSGRSIETKYVPARGSRVWPFVTGAASVLLLVEGAAKYEHPGSTYNSDTGNYDTNSKAPWLALSVVGVAGIAATVVWFAWSHAEHFEAALPTR